MSGTNTEHLNLLQLNNASREENETETTSINRSLAETISIGIVLAALSLVTVGGNLLVCVTVAMNRRLHNTTNYFIASLATTDLLLGCVVLPFSAFNTLSSKWIFGAIFCNIYNSCDVTFCTVSILTLFAISLDRYLAVTRPLRYMQRMSSKIVWQINAVIWIFSLLMAFLPIHFGWNSVDGRVQNMKRPELCVFELNKPYVLVVALCTYFAPLVVMCGLYMRVLQITRDQVREINRFNRIGGDAKSTTYLMVEDNGTTENLALNELTNHSTQPSPQHSRFARRRSRKSKDNNEQKIVSDRKATATLASVLLAFAICWIPYFVLFTAKPFMQTPVDVTLDLVFLWLGYINSAINPFLYAFYNSAFREGFKRVLCHHRNPSIN